MKAKLILILAFLLIGSFDIKGGDLVFSGLDIPVYAQEQSDPKMRQIVLQTRLNSIANELNYLETILGERVTKLSLEKELLLRELRDLEKARNEEQKRQIPESKVPSK